MMFIQLSTRNVIAMIIVTGMLAGFAACNAGADEGHAGHQHGQATHNHADSMHDGHHGGQVSKSERYCFEVVYQPQETRIYLYDHDQKHLSMRGVNGRAAMQIRGSDQVYQFPLQYAAVKSDGHDYLSFTADVSRIRDGDMTVTFALNNLPITAQPAASFTQTFALSKISSSVTVAPLIDADRTGIARQALCPVMGTQLGSHGTPIKLMMGDQRMYVCCKGCIREVQMQPKTYLAKIAARRE